MALFNAKDKKKEGKADAAPVVTATAATPVAVPATITAMLLSPRITEKATDMAGNNTYVFNVAITANKRQVQEAVKALYKVDAQDVRIVTVPTKSIRHPRRGTYGASAQAKKAYVQLKKGDVISIM